MPQESGSCVISMEKGSTRSDLSSSVPPEAKRRKLSASDMSSSSDGDGAILLPGRKVCVVVKTALPVLLGGTVKAAVVCSWKKQSDVRCNWSCEVVELGSVVLSMEQVTDRSLQCSKDCLSMWKGRLPLALISVCHRHACLCLFCHSCRGENFTVYRHRSRQFSGLGLFSDCKIFRTGIS